MFRFKSVLDPDIDPVVLKDIHGTERRMGFTDGCQDLACGQQYIVLVHISRGQHFSQAVQVVLTLVDRVGDELFCNAQVQLDIGKNPNLL